MAEEFSRTDRVAQFVQRELAELIRREVKDPRVGMVTLNEVKVSRDLAYATVYVTFLGMDDAQQIEDAVGALNHAAGFLRHHLRGIMQTRKVPELRFRYDELPEQSERMDRLISDAVKREELNPVVVDDEDNNDV